MGESGSPRRGEPPDHGELIQFGGLPVRWPFRLPRLPPLPRVQRPATVAVAALAIGLLIGFFGGRLTAHRAGPAPRPQTQASTPGIAPQLATSAIAMTGGRCAVQVGQNLQLGVEIRNETPNLITLGVINPVFPLGGLRAISSGVGTCGALPANDIPWSASLAPGDIAWIYTTVAVLAKCPEPLPVWFRVGDDGAGRTETTVLAGFPDLGPVRYKRCSQLASHSSSASTAIVDSASGRSYRG